MGLPIGLFPSGFPAKTLYMPLPSPVRAIGPARLILLDVLSSKVETCGYVKEY